MPIELISKIEPKNSGAFPVVEDTHLEGGFRVVQNLTERNGIVPLNRKEGMYVWVVDAVAAYRLDGGILNSNWEEANFGGEGQFIVHKNMPLVANDQVLYQGWVPFDSVLVAVRVFMHTVNTQGNYTLTVTNVNTGTSVLASSPFDMNTLSPANVTLLPVSGTAANIEFATEGRFIVSFVSDNAAFDGEGVYFELYFQGGVPSTPGGTTTPILAEVLEEGNVTGGRNIILTSGDSIVGFSDLGIAGDVQITGGTATGLGPDDGGDVVFTPGSGIGGGADGEARVAGDLRVTGQLFGLAPRRFVFQPSGTAEGNVYTDFALLYADLDAASGFKEIIFDTSVVTPATIPAGTYDFANTILSDGNTGLGSPAVPTTPFSHVVFAPGALVSNALSFRGLRLVAPGSGTSPLQYSGGNTYLMTVERCRFESGGITYLMEVHDNSTILSIELFNSSIINSGGNEVVYVHDDALLTVVAEASSVLSTQTLIGDATALFGTAQYSASSDMNLVMATDQTNWLGASPASITLEDAAERVSLDPTGLTVVTAEEVQGAIEELDAALGAGGVTSVNGDTGPVVVLGLDDILSAGSITGGNNVTLTVGDEIRGEYAVFASGNPGGDLVLRGGTGDAAGDGGDLVLHPGAHGGAGTDGEARVVGNLNVTGKLTVAGSIDPTDVTFELSPAPTTGATQAAIFASDGTSGLNSGEVYMRKSSNGAFVSLEGSGGGSGDSLLVTGITCTSSEQVGDVVYISSADTVARAQANSASTTFATGIITVKPTSVTCEVVVGGSVTVLSGLTPGTRYYLDESTPGALRATPPPSSGDFIVKIGVALNSTTLILQLDPPVLLT